MQTQELILTPAELEDFQNFSTQNMPPTTSTELAITDFPLERGKRSQFNKIK